MGKNARPHRRAKKRKDQPFKVQPCLNCERAKVKLVFNPNTKIFEGRRICKSCWKLPKFKYYGGS